MVSKIRISNLTYAYKKNIILKNVNVEFDPHDITIITGDNGQGKTTFLYLLAGILHPNSGHIKHTYKNPMCSFQIPILLNRSVYNNVLHSTKVLGIDDPHNAVKNALEKVGLSDKKDVPANTLSGGQKMRLQIARMIASESQLWLLDEPYSGLDLKAIFALDKIILEAHNKGTKIFIITHNLDVIRRLGQTVSEVNHQNVSIPIDKNIFLQKN